MHLVAKLNVVIVDHHLPEENGIVVLTMRNMYGSV